MAVKTKPYPFLEHIQNEEDARDFLVIMIEENGIQGLVQGLNLLAKHKGMTQVAKDADLSRQSLYRSLSEDGNPKLETIDKVVRALGFKLTVEKL